MQDVNLNNEATNADNAIKIVADLPAMTQEDLRHEVEERIVECCNKLLFGVPTDEEATRNYFGHYPPTYFEVLTMVSGDKSARNTLSDREIHRNHLEQF